MLEFLNYKEVIRFIFGVGPRDSCRDLFKKLNIQGGDPKITGIYFCYFLFLHFY